MLRIPARTAALLAMLSSFAAAPAASQQPCYGLMPFKEAPTPDEREAWVRRGVEILSYFEGDLYRVRLARCRSGRILAESSGGLIQLEPESRVDERLWAGQFDDFQITLPDGSTTNTVLNRDGSLNLMVTFHEGVPVEQVTAVLEAHALARRRIADDHWAVRITPTSLRALASQQVVQWIEDPPPPRRPDNDLTRTALGVDDVQRFDTVAGRPTGLAGRGIRVGIFDFGIDEQHADLGGRVVVNDVTPNSHGTHVAGIVAGEGTITVGVDTAGKAVAAQRFQWRGMAPMAELLDAHAEQADTAATYQHYIQEGMHLSNHSYSVTFDGGYRGSTTLRDALIRGDARIGEVPVPPRLQVYSAGNRGNWAPPAWKRQGTQTGYFSLTKQMKNALVIGNLEMRDGRFVIAATSSMGPTHDGRIKPDLVAPGTAISSTGYCDVSDVEDSECGGEDASVSIRHNYYRPMSGTSMAAPAVTGILALVLEQYRVTYGAGADLPPPAALRAILINTAADIAGPPMRQIAEGPVQAFPGPDFVTGWGLVQAGAAAALVERRELVHGSITASCDSVPFDIDVSVGGALRVTLAWDDVAADAGGDPLAPKLVNDLDLVLVDPAGTRHRPWLLDQVVVDDTGAVVLDDQQQCGRRPTVRRNAIPVAASAPQPDPLKNALAPAVRGRDHLNNVEQVLVENPLPGRWRMWVIGFDVRQGPQTFSLAGPTVTP